jgi:hypothetical protein
MTEQNKIERLSLASPVLSYTCEYDWSPPKHRNAPCLTHRVGAWSYSLIPNQAERLARNKHSSLFYHSINDKEKNCFKIF